MTTFVNLTPHAIDVIGDDGAVILSVPASGDVARIPETAEPLPINGSDIPCFAVNMRRVQGLPLPVPGTVLIVSLATAVDVARRGYDTPDESLDMSRYDLVYPYDQVRDNDGRIVGCRAFAQIR